MFLGIPCLVLALWAFGQELYHTARNATGQTKPQEITPTVELTIARRRAIAIVAWTLSFFLAIWLLRFVIAVPVACFLYFRFAGGEKWSLSILLSLAAGAVFYGLFDYILHLPFPEGMLFQLVEN